MSARSACFWARFYANRRGTLSTTPSKRFAVPPSPAARPKLRRPERRTKLRYGHLQQALDRVRALDLPAAYQLTRAFGFYFELINLAETNHRKRRRLSHQLSENASSTGAVQRGDLRGTLRRLREAGVSAGEAYTLLRRICVSPIFTAPPLRSPAAALCSSAAASPTC